MQKHLFIFISFLLIANLAFSQYQLEIEITALKNDKGLVMLQLFDKDEQVLMQEMKTIQDKKCVVIFNGLKPGKYAVRYYHDENLSKKMETNFYGKPLEGYGFSNNVTGKFGPPRFEKWLFDVVGDTKIILKPVY